MKSFLSVAGSVNKCPQISENLPTVEAQGKVELVTDSKTGATHYRLIIGNKPTDYMVVRFKS